METVGRTLRLIRRSAKSQDEAIAHIKGITDGFDYDHVAYLIRHGIKPLDMTPPTLRPMAMAWIAFNSPLPGLSEDELVEVALIARPDCADLFSTAEGRQWLWNSVH